MIGYLITHPMVDLVVASWGSLVALMSWALRRD